MRLPGWIGRIAYWFVWPGTWLYLRWSTRTRVVVYYDGKILAVRGWLSNGRLHLPGGGVHGDESAAHGAVRELFEETGLALHEAEIQHLATETYRHGGMQFNCHYFVYVAGFRPVAEPKFPEIINVIWLDRYDINYDTCNPDVMRGYELAIREIQRREAVRPHDQAPPA